MRNRLSIAILAMAIGVSSCNMPATETTTIPVTGGTPPVLDTPTSSTASPVATLGETLAEIELPTPTASSTPNVFLAAAKDQPVNCRFGPETSYAVIGALLVGRQAEIIGRNEDASWWYVRNPSDPSTSCWLSAEFVQTQGDVLSRPVVSSPQVMVTRIDVIVSPPVLNVACDALPQVVTISAQITSSGPATVVWHWTSSAGIASPDKQVLFEEGATKTVQDVYEVSTISDYIIQVQTTLPNIMIGQSSLKVVCNP